MSASETDNLLQTFRHLHEVVHELREKCPWDRAQTKESLRHLTLEEVYEMGDAILNNDFQELKTELGDVLLHILFYSRIAEEQGQFTTTEMMQTLIDKLIRRHPHIYGDLKATTAEEVTKNWEQIKQAEKAALGQVSEKKKSVLSGVPQGMPALIKAQRIQEKVSSVGFDWENVEQVWAKVEEEMAELRHEVKQLESGEGEQERVEKEFGDLLFSLVNYSRFVKVNPEDALESSNRKFKNRFEYLEVQVAARGGDLKAMSLAEMDQIWEESKRYFH